MMQENQSISLSPKRSLSRIGWGIFAFFAVTYALQLLLSLLLEAVAPALLESTWGVWLLSSVPMYLFAFPLFFLILRPIPHEAPREEAFRISELLVFFFISYFLMYVGNMAGTLINGFTSLFGVSSSADAIELIGSSDLLPIFLIAGVIGPIVEELMFRKLILERLYPFGEKFAILLSALLFALFHGNLTQFIYAFLLGAVFGYLYCRTGRILYPILLHMIINLMGSLLPMLVLRLLAPLLSLLEAETAPTAETLLAALPSLLILFGYLLLIFVLCLLGLIFLCCSYKKVYLWPPDHPLPKGTFPRAWLSVGTILAALTFLSLFILSYL